MSLYENNYNNRININSSFHGCTFDFWNDFKINFNNGYRKNNFISNLFELAVWK